MEKYNLIFRIYDEIGNNILSTTVTNTQKICDAYLREHLKFVNKLKQYNKVEIQIDYYKIDD